MGPLTMSTDLLIDCGLLLAKHQVAPSIIQQVINTLRQRYGGERVFIPKIDRQTRNQQITEDTQRGLSPEAIARRRGCDPKTVRSVQRTWTL